MSNDPTPVSSWATGSNDTWLVLKKGFKHLSIEYANLADKASQEVSIPSSRLLLLHEYWGTPAIVVSWSHFWLSRIKLKVLTGIISFLKIDAAYGITVLLCNQLN